MIEISYLNKEPIGQSPHERLAQLYSGLIRDLFFDGNEDQERPSTRIVPVGFLLYNNVHPEFRAFMAGADSWDFLNALTRDHLHIFSVKPKKAGEPLSEADESRIIEIAKAFSLGDVFLCPYLILLDLILARYEIRGRDRVYYTKLGKIIQVKIANRKSDEYTNAFRDALGRAIEKGWRGSESPATSIVDSIGKTSFSATFLQAAEILFREDFAKKFAAIWVLLNWRPRRL